MGVIGFLARLWSILAALFSRGGSSSHDPDVRSKGGVPIGEYKIASALRGSGASVPWGGYYFRSSAKRRWKMDRQRG